MKYILILISLMSILQAVPARGGERSFTQDNGVTFVGEAKGNQHLNWIESSDGEILKYNSLTKNFELAEIKDNNLKPSGVIYQDGIRKSQSLESVKLNSADVHKLWSQKQKAHRLKMGYDK